MKQACLFVAVLGITSVPFYAAGPLLGSLRTLTRADLPATALMVLCPAVSAVAVAAWTGTGHGLAERLLRRPQGWWTLGAVAVPAAVLVPAGAAGAEFEAGPAAAIGLTGLFLAAAAAEETGWSAFLLPRLLTGFGEVAAALVIGSVSSLWHLVPHLQAGETAGWILGQSAFTLAFHCVLVRLVVGSGGSVWPAVLGHGASNAVWALSPRGGADYDPWAAAALMAALAAVLYGVRAAGRRRRSA